MKKNQKSLKKPWPTKKAMEQVYELNLWGKSNAMFYSGEGSHIPEITQPYIEKVTTFLTSFKKPLNVLDLGCGDFNIGKQLVHFTNSYCAVDIVPNLIAYNKENFSAENLEFLCLDIAKDKLPEADCVILRQVLQHLSNAEVTKILDSLKKYTYVLLTEHIPNGTFIANKDIISGQGIRIKKQSGIDILMPPFNWTVKNKKELFSYDLNIKGKIVTTLYEV